jgi:hypothetical protein
MGICLWKSTAGRKLGDQLFISFKSQMRWRGPEERTHFLALSSHVLCLPVALLVYWWGLTPCFPWYKSCGTPGPENFKLISINKNYYHWAFFFVWDFIRMRQMTKIAWHLIFKMANKSQCMLNVRLCSAGSLLKNIKSEVEVVLRNHWVSDFSTVWDPLVHHEISEQIS